MTTEPAAIVTRHLRELCNLGPIGGLGDGQLLERFATRDREAAGLAFAALVERHGPMVLRVCRSVLRHEHDAQDAFQATFLILARKSASIRDRGSIAGWLFGVSSRVASHARSSAARRRAHEREYAELATRRAGDLDRERGDLVSRLHEEIGRLPERYRAPVVLCDLEGLTHDQAAHHLGCPVGTVKSRLARGRARLGRRLGCHVATASLPKTVLSTSGGMPSRGLIDVTTSSALGMAAGHLPAGSVSASVPSLATGVLRMMRMEEMKRWVISASMTCSLAGSGLAVAGMLAGPDSAAPARAEAPRVPIRREEPAPPPTADPMIIYDVTFLEDPGLSLRKSGLTFDFDHDPPEGLSLLSDKKVELLTVHIRTDPRARVVQAPAVSAPPWGMAVITNPDDHSPPSSFVAPRPLGNPVTPGRRDGPWACSVRLRGDLDASGRYISMNVAIRDRHVVEMHADVTRDGRRIEVPEVARKDVDRRVTIPASGGAMLIGLGIYRTVGGGSPTIAERFVLIRTRKLAKSGVTLARPDAPPTTSRG